MPYKTKEQDREHSRQYYAANREKVLIRTSKYAKEHRVDRNRYRRKQTRNKKAKLVASRGGKCEHCQQSFIHPCVYDFHHIDPTVKEFGIGFALTRTSIPIEDLLKELDKCLMLCANCHRIEHVRLRGDLDEQGNST